MTELEQESCIASQDIETIKEYVRQKCEEYYCYRVYMHTLPDRKIYIGYCKGNPNNRWRNGANYAGHKEFYAAIQKFSWENITHDILAENLSREEAQERERLYILAYESYKPEIGYNREVPAAHDDKEHFSVYQLIFPNGRMYVGKTGLPLNERWRNGNGYNGMPEMEAAIREYGWENVYKIPCMVGICEESATNMEKMLIEMNTRVDPNRVYNKSVGGITESGWVRSGESVARSVETKRRKGAYHTRAVKNLTIGEVYPSRAAAAKALGVSSTSISAAVRKGFRCHGCILTEAEPGEEA